MISKSKQSVFGSRKLTISFVTILCMYRIEDRERDLGYRVVLRGKVKKSTNISETSEFYQNDNNVLIQNDYIEVSVAVEERIIL